tara:strand:+ start:163 stop:384 length:222 start_codon:yes stop_codon:yes gene_type:complete
MKFLKMFFKKKTVEPESKAEPRVHLICDKCGYNWTSEYKMRYPEEMKINPRPWYGDHCSCGGMIVAVTANVSD